MATTRSPGQRSTRQRMLDSAIVLLREKGAASTTVDAVLAHSGAPRGSVYHHFPGGRRQLLTDAVTEAGEIISGLIRRTGADGKGPAAVLHVFADLWRAQLLATDYRAGCPVLAVAVDHDPEDTELTDLVRDTTAQWVDDLSAGLIAHAVDPARAARLATLIVAAIEGAVVLCRLQRTADPLDTVLAELEPLLKSADRARTQRARP